MKKHAAAFNCVKLRVENYGTSDQFMNSYITLRKASFYVAYMDVGEGREQDALSFTNLRNSSLLRAIRCLEPDFPEYNLFRPELIRAPYNKMHQFNAQRAVLKINLSSIKKCAKNNNEVCH